MSNKYKKHGKYKKHTCKPVYKSTWQRFKEYMLKETGSGMRTYPNWFCWLVFTIIILVIIIEFL